jgi:hypothetical protein
MYREHETEQIEAPKIPDDMVELFTKVITLCKEYVPMAYW